MIEYLLFAGGLLFLCVGAYVVYASRRLYREARVKQRKIDWAVAQMERAFDQTHSNIPTEVLTGLQTLCVINLPEVRPKVIRRLGELSESQDPIIAKQAEAALLKFSRGANL